MSSQNLESVYKFIFYSYGSAFVTGTLGTVIYPIYNSYNIYKTFKNNNLGDPYTCNDGYYTNHNIPKDAKYNLYVSKIHLYKYKKGYTYSEFISYNNECIMWDIVGGSLVGMFFIISFPYYIFMKSVGYIVDKIEEINDK